MPPSDSEPRYRLVDSNGNVVGALWGDGNGNVKIADETNTQTTFGPDGISTPALEAGGLTVGNGDNIGLIEHGQVTIAGPTASNDDSWSTYKSSSTTESFNQSFDSEPSVAISFTDIADAGLITQIDNVTDDDFRVLLRNYATTDKSGEDYDIGYIAMY